MFCSEFCGLPDCISYPNGDCQCAPGSVWGCFSPGDAPTDTTDPAICGGGCQNGYCCYTDPNTCLCNSGLIWGCGKLTQ